MTPRIGVLAVVIVALLALHTALASCDAAQGCEKKEAPLRAQQHSVHLQADQQATGEAPQAEPVEAAPLDDAPDSEQSADPVDAATGSELADEASASNDLESDMAPVDDSSEESSAPSAQDSGVDDGVDPQENEMQQVGEQNGYADDQGAVAAPAANNNSGSGTLIGLGVAIAIVAVGGGGFLAWRQIQLNKLEAEHAKPAHDAHVVRHTHAEDLEIAVKKTTTAAQKPAATVATTSSRAHTPVAVLQRPEGASRPASPAPNALEATRTPAPRSQSPHPRAPSPAPVPRPPSRNA